MFMMVELWSKFEKNNLLPELLMSHTFLSFPGKSILKKVKVQVLFKIRGAKADYLAWDSGIHRFESLHSAFVVSKRAD